MIYGEIGIRSEFVAPGYWKRKEQTEAAFIEAGGGKRIYRTGDMGRLLWDGSIEYVKRRDEQVKVRGYRVELGEIESVLRRLGGVSGAVVVARESEEGGRELIGYIKEEVSGGADDDDKGKIERAPAGVYGPINIGNRQGISAHSERKGR